MKEAERLEKIKARLEAPSMHVGGKDSQMVSIYAG